MKHIFFSLLFLFLLSTLIQAQDENMSMDEEMKAWMEYATPGPMHEHLAKHVGEWTSVNTMWMAPGAEPMVSEGAAVFEMVMGGRYLIGNFTGNWMGMPFEGKSIQGYDNALGVFNSIWIDNFGTGFMTGKGNYDEATKTFHSSGSYVDPLTKSDKKYRETFVFEGDDKILMEMFAEKDGEEFKTMEIVFTRKK